MLEIEMMKINRYKINHPFHPLLTKEGKEGRFVMILVIICCLLFSCNKITDQVDENGNGIIHLKYWCASNSHEIDLAKYLVKEWNETHPNILIELQPIPASQSSEEVLLAAIAGKTTPDICSNMWPGAMDDFTSSGGLVNFDRFPDFFDYIGKRVPIDLLESFQSPDGKYYQLPWKTNPTMLMYNVKTIKIN